MCIVLHEFVWIIKYDMQYLKKMYSVVLKQNQSFSPCFDKRPITFSEISRYSAKSRF